MRPATGKTNSATGSTAQTTVSIQPALDGHSFSVATVQAAGRIEAAPAVGVIEVLTPRTLLVPADVFAAAAAAIGASHGAGGSRQDGPSGPSGPSDSNDSNGPSSSSSSSGSPESEAAKRPDPQPAAQPRSTSYEQAAAALLAAAGMAPQSGDAVVWSAPHPDGPAAAEPRSEVVAVMAAGSEALAAARRQAAAAHDTAAHDAAATSRADEGGQAAPSGDAGKTGDGAATATQATATQATATQATATPEPGIRFTTPLLCIAEVQEPAIWWCERAHLIYIKVYGPQLQFAEVVAAATDEERWYLIERLDEAFGLRDRTLLLAGDTAACAEARKQWRRRFGKRFKRVVCA